MAGMRHELKFYIDAPSMAILSSRLSAVLSTDFNMSGKEAYHVRSLYFDDPENSAFFDKVNGVENRCKYRIRFYNGDLSYLRLEKKEKIGKMTRKTMQAITREEAEGLLFSKPDMFSREGLFSEFSEKIHYERFRPVLFVDYLRKAYCYPVGNVRVTLDFSLKGAKFDGTLLGNGPFFPAQMKTDYILEIKYDSMLPPHIRELFADIPKVSSAISKYCLLREYFL